ncbi:MAG: DNA polymerase I, partial [Deltaproteobacteria bacterium]
MARKTAKKRGRAYLLDISHFIFRAYHGMPEMATSAGVPTNAVRGVATMLQALIREEDPEFLVAVFDPGGGSFRNEVYPEYKANRGEPDEDIKVQFPLVERLV